MDPRPLICLFAKPPTPGSVKTRIAAAVGEATATALASAFLRDTIDSLLRLDWARTVIATIEPFQIESSGLAIWDQGSGDLGARQERILRRALTQAPIAIAVGADSPGLPRDRFEQARDLLQSHDAVLGPAEDGGFYLLGLKRCPEGLLADLPWSQAETCARTEARLVERGLTVARIEPWFDVDRPEDLDRLRTLLAAGEIDAPHTERALRRFESLDPA